MPTLPMFRPEGQTIAELLMRQGDIAGRAALARGAAWGNAIAGIGEAATGAYTQYKQQKDQQKREQMLDAAMMEFDPANPRAFYRKAAVAVGATEAARLMTGLASMMKVGQGQEPTPADLKSVLGSLSAARKVYRDEGLTQRWSTMAPLLKKYEPLLGAPVPDDYTPQVGEWIDQTLAGLDQQQKAPGTRLITRRLPDGSEVQEIVEDKPGKTYTSAPEPKKEESASLETRIANAYAAGDQQLVAQLLNLKARMAAAGREPDKPVEAKEYTLNPEGVVLSSYGVKEKDEVRRQAMERGLPVFETAATQGKGTILAGIVRDAVELKTLLSLDKVKAAIGPISGRWSQLKSKVADLDPDVQRAIQLMTSLSDTELRKRSGAAINESEMQRILRFATDPNRPVGHNLVAVGGILKSGNRDYKTLSGVELVPPDATLEWKHPNGTVYRFDSPEKLAAFKKAAGVK